MNVLQDKVEEEPYPGWLRVEPQGQRPFYKTPFPRTVIRSAAMLKEYLRKQNAHEKMMEVDAEMFTFKRRYGMKQMNSTKDTNKIDTSNRTEIMDLDGNEEAGVNKPKEVVVNL